MSPRLLARASSPFMAATSTADTTMASHAVPAGVTKDSPDTAKNASQTTTATNWVEATITSGGMSCARPLTTANCAAGVTAAPSDSANQLRLSEPSG
jgi:hypothetical protein